MTGCGRKLGPFDCCTVVCGDCLELMKQLPDGCVDAAITDPPYGVLEPGDLFSRIRNDKGGNHGLARLPYDGYVDTYANFVSLIVPRLNAAIALARRAAVFTGPHITEQKKFTALGGVYSPAGSGRHPWGFKVFLPVLFYGTAAALAGGIKVPNVLWSCDHAEPNGHPCPKPETWMLWLTSLASQPCDTILDPFLGSGTTAVAAKKLGRHFLGFEISPEYCEIARRRLALVEAQPTLFEKKPEQLSLAH